MLDALGLPRRRPLRQGPAADPRDLPARRAVPDRRRRAAPTSRWRCSTCRSAGRRGCSCAATDYGRFVSCLVYLPARPLHDRRPPARCTTSCARRSAAELVDYTARVSESVLARLHFVVRTRAGHAAPRRRRRRRSRRGSPQATRSWEDDLADGARRPASARRRPRRAAQGLRRRLPGGLQGGLRRRAPGVVDIRHLEELADERRPGAQPLRAARAPARRAPASRSTAAARPISLVDGAAGAAAAGRRGRRRAAVRDRRPPGRADVGLRLRPAARRPGLSSSARSTPRFQEAFRRRAGAARPRPTASTRSSLSAGLDLARRSMVLRAYAKYLRQTGIAFSQEYVEQSLVGQRRRSRALLVELFEARFDPGLARRPRRARRSALRGRRSRRALDAVASLDQDRILRSFLAVDRRDAAHQLLPARRRRRAQAATSRSSSTRRRCPTCPQPRPLFEIWVYSPAGRGRAPALRRASRAAGCAGRDRREDFRTEVLGLVKAQMVKNAVIVPVGAKGGFVVKAAARPGRRPRRLAGRGRRLLPHVHLRRCSTSPTTSVGGRRSCRRPTSSATTATTPTSSSPPTRARRRSPTSPTTSPAQYGFWLGDAFASGGSAGYDHKAMGITARGAWESVKRHFRELGVDTQTQDFTVVGIGDMSGDVFGNGMLLSRAHPAGRRVRPPARLPRPDPDAARLVRRAAAAVRRCRARRWADYDPALHQRGRRRLPAHGEVDPGHARRCARVLGLRRGRRRADARRADPRDPARAGRPALERRHRHLREGRRARPTPRSATRPTTRSASTAPSCAARVVGEGGNLGFTQRGRIESRSPRRAHQHRRDRQLRRRRHLRPRGQHQDPARPGGARRRPHGQAAQRAAGRDDRRGRPTSCCATTTSRTSCSATPARRARSMLPVHAAVHRARSRRAATSTARWSSCPTTREIDARRASGRGPDLARSSRCCSAYAKIDAHRRPARRTELPTSRGSRGCCAATSRRRCVERFDAIGSTRTRCAARSSPPSLVNDMVNRGGITFAFRAGEETGAGPVEVARAYAVAREVFGLPELWRRIEALDNQVPTAAQCALFLESRRLLDRATRWLLHTRAAAGSTSRPRSTASPSEVARARRRSCPTSSWASSTTGSWRAPRSSRRSAHRTTSPSRPARCSTRSRCSTSSRSRRSTETDAEEVARLYFVLSERYEVDRMLTRITHLPRDDRWSALARAALRYDLYGALRDMTRRVIITTTGITDPMERILAGRSSRPRASPAPARRSTRSRRSSSSTSPRSRSRSGRSARWCSRVRSGAGRSPSGT